MNRDVRTLAHYQGCVPFRLVPKSIHAPFDGPNPPIYDLNSGGHRDKIQGKDYDFFCPVITAVVGPFAQEFQAHRGTVLNEGSSFRKKYGAKDVFERCINLDANPHCKSTKSLEQLRSPKLTLGKFINRLTLKFMKQINFFFELFFCRFYRLQNKARRSDGGFSF